MRLIIIFLSFIYLTTLVSTYEPKLASLASKKQYTGMISSYLLNQKNALKTRLNHYRELLKAHNKKITPQSQKLCKFRINILQKKQKARCGPSFKNSICFSGYCSWFGWCGFSFLHRHFWSWGNKFDHKKLSKSCSSKITSKKIKTGIFEMKKGNIKLLNYSKHILKRAKKSKDTKHIHFANKCIKSILKTQKNWKEMVTRHVKNHNKNLKNTKKISKKTKKVKKSFKKKAHIKSKTSSKRLKYKKTKNHKKTHKPKKLKPISKSLNNSINKLIRKKKVVHKKHIKGSMDLPHFHKNHKKTKKSHTKTHKKVVKKMSKKPKKNMNKKIHKKLQKKNAKKSHKKSKLLSPTKLPKKIHAALVKKLKNAKFHHNHSKNSKKNHYLLVYINKAH